jgi:hypothetical protein
VIDEHLEEDEPAEVLNPIEKKGIDDGDKVKEAEEVVKLIGHRDEEILPLGELKDISNSQEKGEDDHPADHQPLHILEGFLVGIRGKG